jgi:hypothetical protein
MHGRYKFKDEAVRIAELQVAAAAAAAAAEAAAVETFDEENAYQQIPVVKYTMPAPSAPRSD